MNDKIYNSEAEYMASIQGPVGPAGKDGENYVLTEQDKTDIAAKIEVPVVEKEIETIIEKTIVHEQPIVTNEIKEIAVADSGEIIIDKINKDETSLINKEKVRGLDEIEKLARNASKVSYGGLSGIKGLTAGTSITINTSNPQYPVISSSGSGSQTPWTSDIDAANYNLTSVGSLGIGTMSPTALLEVSGSSDSGDFMVTNNSGSGSISVASLLAPSATGDTYFSIGRDLSVGNAALIGHSTTGGGDYAFLTIYGRPASDFTVSSSGNIGINTTSPVGKLDILGTDASSNASPAPLALNTLAGNGAFDGFGGGSAGGGYSMIAGNGAGGDAEGDVSAGAGGSFSFTAGLGGDLSGGVVQGFTSIIAGAGGSLTLTGGNGGNADLGLATNAEYTQGGDGGDINLLPGTGGTATGGDAEIPGRHGRVHISSDVQIDGNILNQSGYELIALTGYGLKLLAADGATTILDLTSGSIEAKQHFHISSNSGGNPMFQIHNNTGNGNYNIDVDDSALGGVYLDSIVSFTTTYPGTGFNIYQYLYNDGNTGSGGNAYLDFYGDFSSTTNWFRVLSGNGLGSLTEQFSVDMTNGYVYLSNLPTSSGGPTGSLYQVAGVLMVN